MQQPQAGTEFPRFSVVWEAGRTPQAVGSVDHAAHYAMALAHALASAGYPPRRLEITIEEPSAVELDLAVHGDVPGLDEASFGSIARIAVSGCRIWQALPSDAQVRLRATLSEPAGTPVAALPGRAATGIAEHALGDEHDDRDTMLAMAALLAIAVLVYLVAHPPFQAGPAPVAVSPPAASAATQAVPTPTVRPALQTVMDEHFLAPSGGWPNDPTASASFGAGGYHLVARNPGEFVSVGVPLGARVQDVVVGATFVKTGGPDGGGYGLVVRDQAPSPPDGQVQVGRFLVFEVGDRGEFGVWQREGARWVEIVPWTRSDAVRPGRAQNEMVVIAHADQLSFVVNGQQVAGFDYTALPASGGVGLFAAGDLNEVTVGHLSIQIP